jgi:hypothetical protein
MGVKRRTSKRKIPITPEESAWLIGDEQNSGFTLFAGDADYLPNLWLEHGANANYTWTEGMLSPEMIEAAN